MIAEKERDVKTLRLRLDSNPTIKLVLLSMQIVIRPTTKFEKGNQQSYLSIMYILEKYRNISCFKNIIPHSHGWRVSRVLYSQLPTSIVLNLSDIHSKNNTFFHSENLFYISVRCCSSSSAGSIYVRR